ncbi:ABC transporter permease [Agromyces archimandritae]|uniref:ABC transporter permease n=1 Tax=Agromyces archimandritae TaxID=2781962 RepID=A0A975IMT9_9MICO|nr:ABC transporter permease [Agromyces archimandritae]QTX03815.1 ABC transporter permease [Agromyces archimandritae]
MTALKNLAYLLALPVLLILWWWWATIGTTSFFAPTPGELVTTFVDTWFGPRFQQDILPSLGRLLVGIVLAIVLGVGLGILIGSVKRLRQLTEPLLEFFRAVPPVVLIPLLMLFLGINDFMKVIVIVSGSIWPILLNTVEGVRATDEVQRDTCASYGIRRLDRLRYLTLPAASPQILAGVRQSLSIALILMVISEMFYSSSGLGFTIVQFQRTFAVPEMWSGILVLGLIGLGLALVFRVVERRILRWYYGLREVQRES